MLLALGMVALPLALIMLQPDLGSAMVLGAAAFGVLVAAGVRARWTLGLLAVGVLGAILVVKMGLLADYQLARFGAFLNPQHDPQGAAYNINQAHIAIANGGWFGTGLFNGPQTNGGYVPEQRTDFVFSVMGEEFGLVGGAVLILLFALLCWRGLRDRAHRRSHRAARRRRDRVLVRLPGVPEHRHEPRADAGHRTAAAVRLLRRVVDVRPGARHRGAAGRAAAQSHRLTDLTNPARPVSRTRARQTHAR